MLHFRREHFKIEFLLRTDLSEVATLDFIDNSVKCCFCIDFQKLMIFNFKTGTRDIEEEPWSIHRQVYHQTDFHHKEHIAQPAQK